MLGNLQEDMKSQGVTTKTKGVCGACNQPVIGQVRRVKWLNGLQITLRRSITLQ